MKYTNVHRHLPPCYFKKGNGLKIIDINTALLRCRRRLFLVVFSFNHRSRKWEKTFYGQKPTTLHFPIVSSSVCPWCSRFSLSLQCYTLYPLETGTSRAAGPGVSRLLWKGRSGPGREAIESLWIMKIGRRSSRYGHRYYIGRERKENSLFLKDLGRIYLDLYAVVKLFLPCLKNFWEPRDLYNN